MYCNGCLYVVHGYLWGRVGCTSVDVQECGQRATRSDPPRTDGRTLHQVGRGNLQADGAHAEVRNRAAMASLIEAALGTRASGPPATDTRPTEAPRPREVVQDVGPIWGSFEVRRFARRES